MQKLENLEITKVAFVPEGDNKRADVLIFKSKPTDNAGEEQNSSEPVIEATAAEANVMKRVLLAIGKAFGFDKAESTEDKTPPVEEDPQGEKDNAGSDDKPAEETKKGVDDMKIDKSKLTPEELAQLEAIEKKAGIVEDTETADDTTVNKTGTSADTNNTTAPATTTAETADDDIYKGLHPAVAAELKELRKRADEAEDKELLAVAKKYEILGKKPEELSKTLKVLKSAGGSAYDDMIGVLDASLATVEKSGAFSEVGKNGSGTPDAWTQIEQHATEIQKAVPTMSRIEAINKACEQHPELVAEYENNR